jgi:XTP/dITP diphosphohydrolase
MKLLIATGNRHKFQEIHSILRVPHLQLIGLFEIPGAPAVEEDGDTFEFNAAKKASTLARFSGYWALADDSGLEVNALGGAPGVWSARYAGEPSHDAANNAKLIKVLKGETNRRAQFRCSIALSDPLGVTRTVSGKCPGTLLDELHGGGGFGYDPLFVPEGFDMTFAEIDPEIKNRISHRARALAAALDEWGGFLEGEPRCWGDWGDEDSESRIQSNGHPHPDPLP